MPTVESPKDSPVAPAEPRNGAASPPRNDAVQVPGAPGIVVVGARNTMAGAAQPAPTTLACLHCQLLGKRRLTCAKADACASLPQVFAIGPILLGAWLVMTIAFVLAVR